MPRELLARHTAGDLVAFGAQGSRTVDDLLRDVAKVSAALPAAPQGSEVTLVIRTDRYALAVAILAAWTRGYVPSLPPELDRDAITALAGAPSTATVLHDTASGIPLHIGALLAEDAPVSAPLPASSWQGRTLISRSYARTPQQTLAPQAWGEDWLGQARALAELLAAEPGLRWATSVGTEHAHGIVLGVLVPLLSGGAFLREPLAPRALAAQLSALQIDMLVSVPAHLPELLQERTGPIQLKRVISALGTLPAPLLEQAREKLGTTVSDLSHAADQIPILHCSSQARAPDAVDAPELRVERFLRAQDGVRDAAVVAVASPAGPRLYAALVGPNLDVRALHAAVQSVPNLQADTLELLVLHRIRRDGIGRAQRSELLRQFRLRPDGSPVNLALVWGESSAGANGELVEHRTRVHVPSDYGYFDGHFSGYPILAGAAQLGELVLPYLRRVRPELNRLTQMSRLKFTGRIQPGQTIDVVLSMRSGTATVDFALKRGEALCSAGTLSFLQLPEEGR